MKASQLPKGTLQAYYVIGFFCLLVILGLFFFLTQLFFSDNLSTNSPEVKVLSLLLKFPMTNNESSFFKAR